MKKPKMIEETPIPMYEVKLEPFDWTEFTQWLEDLEHQQVAIVVDNTTRFFYTEWERLRFVDGFRFAWQQFTGKVK